MNTNFLYSSSSTINSDILDSVNPKEQIVFKKPSNGKKVTRKQFDEISEDKMNSMKDENGAIQINVTR